VPQRYSLGQILVKAERAGYCACNLADLKGVCQSGAVVVTFWAQEYLRFVSKPSKTFAVYYPVAVALVLGAQLARLGVALAPPCFCRKGSVRAKQELFPPVYPLPDRQAQPPLALLPPIK